MTRDDHEWAAAMVSLTVSEKTRIKPSRRQHRKIENGCRTVVQQLVPSIPQRLNEDIVQEKGTGDEIGTRKKTVTFEADSQGLIDVVSKNSEQENLSGESNTSASGHVDKTRWTKFCPGSLDG